jgi:hypothetical protein
VHGTLGKIGCAFREVIRAARDWIELYDGDGFKGFDVV